MFTIYSYIVGGQNIILLQGVVFLLLFFWAQLLQPELGILQYYESITFSNKATNFLCKIKSNIMTSLSSKFIKSNIKQCRESIHMYNFIRHMYTYVFIDIYVYVAEL